MPQRIGLTRAGPGDNQQWTGCVWVQATERKGVSELARQRNVAARGGVIVSYFHQSTPEHLNTRRFTRQIRKADRQAPAVKAVGEASFFDFGHLTNS